MPDLDLTFGALADPSRREMLRLLRRGEMRVTEIAAPFALSLNAVSKHVRALERAGLVRRRVRGREHFIGLAAEPLEAAAGFLDEYREFWEGRLDALEEMLIEGQK
jgi:DNA-binding transcriptional ArsR family regulator